MPKFDLGSFENRAPDLFFQVTHCILSLKHVVSGSHVALATYPVLLLLRHCLQATTPKVIVMWLSDGINQSQATAGTGVVIARVPALTASHRHPRHYVIFNAMSGWQIIVPNSDLLNSINTGSCRRSDLINVRPPYDLNQNLTLSVKDNVPVPVNLSACHRFFCDHRLHSHHTYSLFSICLKIVFYFKSHLCMTYNCH